MRSIIIILMNCIIFCSHIYGKIDDKKPDPILDSLISIIDNKAIPFNQKYPLDSIVRNTPSLKDYRNIICTKLIPKAKQEKAYDELLYLYSNAASYYIGQNKNSISRLYLDSAKFYLDKNISLKSLANYYRNEGDYYGVLKQYDLTHAYYYKAIDAYEKAKINYLGIIVLLRNMSIVHFGKRNYEEVKKIINKMNSIPLDGINKVISRIRIGEVTGGYYIELNRYTKNITYLDSAHFYYKDAIDAYEYLSPDVARKHRSIAFYVYQKLSEIEVQRENTDQDLVEKNISQMKAISKLNDSLQLSIIKVLDASIYIKKRQYLEAEEELKEATKIIDVISKETPEFENEYFDIYRVYINLYKAKKDYLNAIKYIELEHNLRDRSVMETNNQIIKELDTKYETAQKDAQINLLQVEKEKEKQNKITIIGVGVFIVILLIVFLLYNRIQRLKKEKEAADLENRIKEKEAEYQLAKANYESESIRSYVRGLEVERGRLAKELHDNVANQLLAIDMQLRETNVSDKITNQLENLHADVRNISHELIPPMFKYATLPEIIDDFIEKINQRGNIQFEIAYDKEYLLEQLPESYNLEMYRIVQEAAGNILKHSAASNASISFEWINNNLLYLIIKDNGTGFNIDQRTKGVGLQIIKDRVKKLKGIIKIESLENNGCYINIEIPIPPLNEAE